MNFKSYHHKSDGLCNHLAEEINDLECSGQICGHGLSFPTDCIIMYCLFARKNSLPQLETNFKKCWGGDC